MSDQGVDRERLAKLESITLDHGGHPSFDDGHQIAPMVGLSRSQVAKIVTGKAHANAR